MGNILAYICPCCLKRRQIVSCSMDVELTDNLLIEEPAETDLIRADPEHIDDVRINISNLVIQRECKPSDIYDFVNVLGEGAYGTVVKVRHKITDSFRAMKIIKKEQLGVDLEMLESEVRILKLLDHPNIIKIFEFFQDDYNFYIVSELCAQGDLFEKLSKIQTMNEMIVKLIMHQILSAVSYLHSKNVIHGDLKLENILIDSIKFNPRMSFNASAQADIIKLNQERKESRNLKRTTFDNFSKFELKLIDFGCSKIMKQKTKKVTGIIGTSFYVAPEVLAGDYNEKCDMWSCGVLMYILLCGIPPFIGDTDQKVFNEIAKGEFNFNPEEFKNVSNEAKDLIKKLMSYNPLGRLSANEALVHDFFKQDIDPNNIFNENIDSRSVLGNLKQFRSSVKFHQAVTAYITHNFAEKEEISKLRKMFTYLDKNNDGKITKEELLLCYKDTGEFISESEIDGILSSIDNDGDGFIEYEEFIRATLDKKKLFSEVNLKAAFDLFDKDKSDEISCSEIKNIIFGNKELPEGLMKEFLGQINKTETDVINFEEFKILMEKGQSRKSIDYENSITETD